MKQAQTGKHDERKGLTAVTTCATHTDAWEDLYEDMQGEKVTLYLGWHSS